MSSELQSVLLNWEIPPVTTLMMLLAVKVFAGMVVHWQHLSSAVSRVASRLVHGWIVRALSRGGFASRYARWCAAFGAHGATFSLHVGCATVSPGTRLAAYFCSPCPRTVLSYALARRRGRIKMASEPTITAPVLERRIQSKALNRYWVLTKPEISLLIAITVFVGFCFAQPRLTQGFPLLRLIHTLFGTLLVASGSSTLNQFMERDFDARMRRTARRPLAAGSVEPYNAL